jgi:hypothetical protein
MPSEPTMWTLFNAFRAPIEFPWLTIYQFKTRRSQSPLTRREKHRGVGWGFA